MKRAAFQLRSGRRGRIFWGIAGGAFILRLGVVLWFSPYLDARQTLSVDALAYHQIAQNLVERQIFTSPVDPPYDSHLPSTFRPPLTPLYLTAIYSLCGVSLTWGRIGLALAGAISCGLTYRLGEQLFDRPIGLLAGLISCGYPFFLLLTHLPLTEGLSIALTLGLLTLFYAAPSGKPQRAREQAIWMGALFGLALLNKTTNLALFPCILMWGLFRAPGSRTQRVGYLVIGATVAGGLILPWTLRNYVVTGAFIPINSNGGWTFYLGNNPYTKQNLTALEQGLTNGWMPPKEALLPFADLAFTDTIAWEQRSRALGFAFVREHPGQFAAFAFRKLKIFWQPYQNFLDQITWYPLALFSIIGVLSSLAAWQKHLGLYLLILATMLIPVLFTSMPRFRAPIMPVLVIYAAAGMIGMYRFFTAKARRREVF